MAAKAAVGVTVVTEVMAAKVATAGTMAAKAANLETMAAKAATPETMAAKAANPETMAATIPVSPAKAETATPVALIYRS